MGRCFPELPSVSVAAKEPIWAESRFCGQALYYLQSERGGKDALFTRLFWQYQRVRCATFRFVTQEPGTRGLDWFVRFFKRISPMRNGLGLRHDPTLLLGWNYPELNLVPDRPVQFSATYFLLRYLTDVGVWRRGQEPIEIAMDQEQAAITQAQRFVQRQVRACDVTIEANPTSNLLIAELGSLDQHPVFRLAPLSWRRWITPEYRIALSDDDPLTFARSLPDEFRHTYFAILRQGYPEDAAICWLKKRRKDAIDAAFTVAESVRCRQRESDA